jgi:hypothetical protein
MDKGKNRSKSLLTLAVLLSLVFAAACAEVRLNLTAVPAPLPTAKLRVFIQMVSGDNPHGWATPHEQYARQNIQGIGRYWQETGIYEVIEEKEVNRVLGNQRSSLNWSRKDWDLAKQVGRVLHADYAMISERSVFGGQHFWATVLINVETGEKFKFSVPVTRGHAEDFLPIVRGSYQKIFSDAKNDLLATAIRKGRQAAPATLVQKAPGLKTPQRAHPRPAPSSERAPSKEPTPSPAISREAGSEKAIQADPRPGGHKKLAVYDLEAPEAHKVVALILSEALRQELFKLGLFQMVNRENIVKVLEEMSLQQAGLVNEKDAVKAGKGLAAQQIVLGRFGTLGKISVLQVKRLDLETQGDLGVGSLKCDVGREDELLQHMEGLAREIAGKK